MYEIPNLRCVSICNISSFILLGFFIYKIQGKLLSPFILLMLCLYLFHSGHLWLSIFYSDLDNFVYELKYPGDMGNAVTVYRDITTLLIIFMSVGILTLKKCTVLKLRDYKISVNIHNFVLLLFILAMCTEIVRAATVSVKGYAAGFRYTSSFALVLADFVNILLYMMLYLCRNNKRLFKRYLFMLVFRALFIMVFVGNRGASVVNILVALYILVNYSYLSYNKSFIKKALVYSVVAMLLILPLISITRAGDSGTGFQGNNPFEYFFMEFGETAWNVFLAKDYIDAFYPLYGMQIAVSTLTIIPMSTSLFGDLFLTYSNIGQMLNEYLGGFTNLGGSMLSQLYMNFGGSNYIYISSIGMALIFSWVSNTLMTKELSIYKMIIFLSLFAGLMMNIRDEWYSTMSYLKIGIYVAALIFFLNKVGLKITYK